MKIYTRTGDQGNTSLLGGARVPKDDDRIEAYGTVDELNAHIGLLRDGLASAEGMEFLESVQELAFVIGSRLAAGSDEAAEKFNVPSISEKDITDLEELMDKWEAGMRPLKHFVLPGGHPAISQAHVCRTVCRRAERRMVHLGIDAPQAAMAVRYMNRLSDLFFMLARHLHATMNVPERLWDPS